MADKLADRIKAEWENIKILVSDGVKTSNPTEDWYEKREIKEENPPKGRYKKLDARILVQKPKERFNTFIGIDLTTIEYKITHRFVKEYSEYCIEVRVSTKPPTFFEKVDGKIVDFVHGGLINSLGYILSGENRKKFYGKMILI